MHKISEKMITFTIISDNVGTGGRLDPNQGLGEDCHAINDSLFEGTAIKRTVWKDEARGGPPDDIQKTPQRRRQTV